MSFEWFVARRYLTARRKQAFISLISGVSILGVGVGVMALIIALALMTGVQNELRDRILGSTAHVYVSKTSGFTDLDADMRVLMRPGVTGMAPMMIGEALMESGADRSFVMLKGIDPARELTVTNMLEAITSGSVKALSERPVDARPGVILGQDLAAKLRVEVGDKVSVITAEQTLTPMGGMRVPRTLEVVGIVNFGFYQVDSAYGFVLSETAQNLLNRSLPDMIQLRVENMDDSPRMADEMRQQLGPDFQVDDWTRLNGSLYAALRLEKIAISLTIGLIVMVAALNIVASLVLLVMEKSKDIAILRTMGAPASAIRRIFMLQGLTIGFIGTAAGTVIGVIVCRVADHYQLVKLSAEVYQIAYLPFRIDWLDVTFVVVAAIAVCFLATIHPARQAGRLDPAEALRNQ